MQPAKMHIWCPILESVVIGPYFFNDDTINGQNAHSMLKELFVSKLKRLRKASSVNFQQDGAAFHFSRDVRQYLDKVSPNRWIGRSHVHQMDIIVH